MILIILTTIPVNAGYIILSSDTFTNNVSFINTTLNPNNNIEIGYGILSDNFATEVNTDWYTLVSTSWDDGYVLQTANGARILNKTGISTQSEFFIDINNTGDRTYFRLFPSNSPSSYVEGQHGLLSYDSGVLYRCEFGSLSSITTLSVGQWYSYRFVFNNDSIKTYYKTQGSDTWTSAYVNTSGNFNAEAPYYFGNYLYSWKSNPKNGQEIYYGRS